MQENREGTANCIADPMATTSGKTVPETVEKEDDAVFHEVSNDTYFNMKQNVKLPEGSIVRVIKPELLIHFFPVQVTPEKFLPEELVALKIKPLDNIHAVKGFAMKRLKELLSSEAVVNPDQIIVTRGTSSPLKEGGAEMHRCMQQPKSNPAPALTANERESDMTPLVHLLIHANHSLSVSYPSDGIKFKVRENSEEIDYDVSPLFD